MKKTYINPQITVVKVKLAQMVAASINVYGRNANEAAMSRRGRGSDWEDEEDGY